ncbi:Kinesin-like protein KIF20A [Dinothrombium tinctorium]|uniref:Kinesin-like protein KIF20A n=1 Tax=Dinothrombium tinctorium TaxID=1965070 RepID=A0A443Q7B1_9ACAR|nr:Kinesin-like protein KIF20A [Dinothrombium tinctorium]
MDEFIRFPDNPREIATVDGREITADLFKDFCLPTIGDKLDTCAHPLVCKFVEVNDCVLFAYGTNSSEKSYTIRGTSYELGVIPPAIHFLFNCQCLQGATF